MSAVNAGVCTRAEEVDWERIEGQAFHGPGKGGKGDWG